MNTLMNLTSSSKGYDELIDLIPNIVLASQQKNWVVLINPPQFNFKDVFKAAGVKIDRVIVIEASDPSKTLWAAEKMISSGNSSLVITWLNEFEQFELEEVKSYTTTKTQTFFITKSITYSKVSGF